LKKAADSAENLINTPDGGQQNNTNNNANQNVNNATNQNTTNNKNTDNANQDSKVAIDLLERINTYKNYLKLKIKIQKKYGERLC
jgi:hypothetical protein